jgi:hypothetical protein
MTDAWLVHKPPTGADPLAPIAVNFPDQNTQQVVITDAQRLDGTYTLVGTMGSYAAPGQRCTMTTTVEQVGTSIVQTLVKAYVSSLNLRPLILGNITLPLVERPQGGSVSLRVTCSDSRDPGFNTFFNSLLLLDTRGQTVASFAQTPGTGDTLSAYLDEPEVGDSIGKVWNSPTANYQDAYAVSEPRVSGGPLTVDVLDNGGAILFYCVGPFRNSNPQTLRYRPRWLAERLGNPPPPGGGGGGPTIGVF